MLRSAVAEADVVITTALIPNRPAPVLVKAEAVATMRRGSVMVDLAADPNPNPDPNPNRNRNPNPNPKPEPDLALGLLERHVDERLVLVRRVPVGELGDEARLHRVVHALEGAVLVVGLQSEERLGLLSDGGAVRDEAQDAELDVARVARDGDEVALWLG